MARRKTAKIMVAAPNPATNAILTSNKMVSIARQEAFKLAQRIAPYAAGHKGRYPTVKTFSGAVRFKGTVRSGAMITGSTGRNLLLKDDAQKALGNSVDWKD